MICVCRVQRVFRALGTAICLVISVADIWKSIQSRNSQMMSVDSGEVKVFCFFAQAGWLDRVAYLLHMLMNARPKRFQLSNLMRQPDG